MPAGITRLQSLASLCLSGCRISFLPSSLSRLKRLRHLALNSTGLLLHLPHTWEAISQLPALEELDLRCVRGRGGGSGRGRGADEGSREHGVALCVMSTGGGEGTAADCRLLHTWQIVHGLLH